MPEVTLATIALKAGVHRSTVSMALRNHPRIPESTRRKLQLLAAELGYRPNPMVTALMQLRRAARSPAQTACIAYLTAFATRNGWREPPYFYGGIEKRCSELGFSVSPFWLKEPGMTPRRMAQILHSRGIRGVIVGRCPPNTDSIEFPFEEFASVSVTLNLREPVTHVVAFQQFFNVCLAFDRCRALRYRRIGLAVLHSQWPRSQERWIGGFLMRQTQVPQGDRVPPLVHKTGEPSRLVDWIRSERVDVVLTGEAQTAYDTLQRARVRVPQRVALVGLGITDSPTFIAGVYNDPSRIGSVAVEVLTAQLYRNEIGLPADPQEVLLDGHWLDGPTAPPLG